MALPVSLEVSSDARAKASKIHAFFSEISGIYDFFNHFFSFGIDYYWRHVLIRKLIRQNPKLVLDLATGSGDVAKNILEYQIQVVAADFCHPMLIQARQKGLLTLLNADAMNLPVAPDTFDAVTIAFGFRNFVNRKQSLGEILRVLKPGGYLYILEFSTPCCLLKPFYYFYLGTIMPFFTNLLFRKGTAYQHLNDSVRAFPNQEGLKMELGSNGFCNIQYVSLTGGIAAIHTCQKAG